MLLFGHAAVTLGASILAVGVLRTVRGTSAPRGGGSEPPSPSYRTGFTVGRVLDPVRSWLTALGEFLDLRLLLIGSLLPDIIDKPLGQVLLRDEVGTGRAFSHTLLFFILVGSLALLMYRRYSRTWLLALAIGTGMHLVLDSMWVSPQTLFWPAYGLAFERIDLSGWAQRLWSGFVTNPAVYLPEIVGLIVAAWLLRVLFRQSSLGVFLWHGKASNQIGGSTAATVGVGAGESSGIPDWKEDPIR